MTKLVNRAKVVTATTGTGTITLGSAVSGFQTFADAGVANGDTVRYVIEDGNNWEIGTGVYTATGTTLSRTVSESSNAGAAINLSGSAVVYVSMSAAEMLQQADIGVSVQAYDANIVSDASYVHTDNNYTTTEKSKLAGIEAGATADQTAAEILTAIKTVDGTGSGLDADLLDGNDSSAFYLATNPNGYTTNTGTVTSVAASVPTGFSISGSPITTSGTLGITYAANYQGYTTTEASKLAGIEAGADVTDAGNVNPLVDSHLNTSSATTGQYLGWNGADYAWSTVSGYTDADVDTHLNTGTAASGEVLSWNGTDYDWVAVSGGATDINGLSDGYAVGGSVGLGSNALLNDDGTNNYNVAVGDSALRSVTTAGGNVAVGFQSMYFTTGTGNVAIGEYAGFSISTGSYNIGIGRSGLRGTGSLSGSNNIGIGQDTGFDLSTGANNFLGGYRAGYNLTTGPNNVAIGNGALDAATTGGRNIAIGQDAMGLGVATGATGDNVAIGFQAGYDLTNGNGNVLIGKGAGDDLTSGGENVIIGFNAGSAFTSSTGVVVIGRRAALNATGSESVAIGQDAQRSATGTRNIALGVQAAYSTTSGNNNISIGYNANYGTTTGTQNTTLGNFAQGITTGSNNTIIGYNAASSSATVSNEITLGNSSITRFRVPGAGIDNTSAALSGTTPSVDVGARDTYTLTTSGNTTFTFTGAPSSGQVGTFSLIITAGGTHTLTWPASVDWAGGTAPDAPASGEKDIYTFMTVDGGTTWYGFLAGDAMA